MFFEEFSWSPDFTGLEICFFCALSTGVCSLLSNSCDCFTTVQVQILNEILHDTCEIIVSHLNVVWIYTFSCSLADSSEQGGVGYTCTGTECLATTSQSNVRATQVSAENEFHFPGLFWYGSPSRKNPAESSSWFILGPWGVLALLVSVIKVIFLPIASWLKFERCHSAAPRPL